MKINLLLTEKLNISDDLFDDKICYDFSELNHTSETLRSFISYKWKQKNNELSPYMKSNSESKK